MLTVNLQGCFIKHPVRPFNSEDIDYFRQIVSFSRNNSAMVENLRDHILHRLSSPYPLRDLCCSVLSGKGNLRYICLCQQYLRKRTVPNNFRRKRGRSFCFSRILSGQMTQFIFSVFDPLRFPRNCSPQMKDYPSITPLLSYPLPVYP